MGKLRITMVASEAVPFAKTGGLADVTGSLCKALAKLGEEVRLILPKYPWLGENFSLEIVRDNLPVPMGKTPNFITINKSYLPESDIPVYFIECKKYFDREHLYGSIYGEYPDNGERFAFFSQAALAVLKVLNLPSDILHCHDWQTALIPVYLKAFSKEWSFFKNTVTVLTLHNLAYQGIFSPEILPIIGGEDLFHIEGLEFWGKVNYLKGGIIFADVLTTVSKTYREEILSSNEYGQGLEGVLRKRENSLRGILNGIDYWEWNPASDQFLPINYQWETLKKKKLVKKALQTAQNLPPREVPILGIVSRLDPQKGLELFIEVAKEILSLDLQLIILGVGEKVYQDFFQNLAKDYPEKVRVNFRLDNPLAHLIYGGADFFLMPSRFEPCGLAQLISMRYGTIPIVRKTGGLADTVVEFDPLNGEGNGFLFENFQGEDLLTAFRKAWQIYQNPVWWRRLQKNAMQADFSWESSTREYQKVYREEFFKKGCLERR